MTSSLLNGDARPNESSFVLDSSALLCVILREPGADFVEASIVAGALISSVNFAEVLSRLAELGFSDEEAYRAADDTEVLVAPFSESQARLCGSFRISTRHLGLSLGDRACLAVGRSLALPVITADRVWSQVDVGVEVVMCR